VLYRGIKYIGNSREVLPMYLILLKDTLSKKMAIAAELAESEKDGRSSGKKHKCKV